MIASIIASQNEECATLQLDTHDAPSSGTNVSTLKAFGPMVCYTVANIVNELPMDLKMAHA